jgi:hypothetical protein
VDVDDIAVRAQHPARTAASAGAPVKLQITVSATSKAQCYVVAPAEPSGTGYAAAPFHSRSPRRTAWAHREVVRSGNP